MLTVAELIEKLLNYPGDTPVTISPDAEGNNIHYASGAGEQFIYGNDDYELSCISPSDTEEITYLKENGHILTLVLEVW